LLREKTMKQATLNLFAAAIMILFSFSDASAQAAVNQYRQLKAKQDWSGALKVIRDEVAQPQLSADNYRANIRIIAIGALGDYVYFRGFDPAIDAEAIKYHREALNLASRDASTQRLLQTVMGRYYSQTQRNGLALPYYRESLEQWKKVNNTFQVIHGYDALASAYADMGEIELRDHHRRLALDVAKGYFKLGISPTDANEWLQYSAMLRKAMDNLARPGNAAQLEPLWSLYESISKRYLTPEAKSYLNAAQYFAIAEDLSRAAGLMETARKTWNGEREKFSQNLQASMDVDFHGVQTLLLLKSKQYAGAVEGFERVAQLRKAVGMEVADLSLSNQRGQSHEGINDWDGAIRFYREGIAASETVRESFDVGARAAFFRSVTRRSYWGLTRAYVRRFQETGNVADLFAALSASEQIRARQLGEILDPKSRAELSGENLQNLRGRIADDEAILCYVVTDSEVLIFALTKDQQAVALVPYDSGKLRAQVLGLARDLARPESNVAQINSRLTELSRDMVAPVQALLQGKKRLQVLPDGLINALPFDLMSSSGQEYRPLFRSHVVRLAPSLRFTEYAARRTAGERLDSLYAIADPVYSKNPQVGGLALSELTAVTRGSKFLSYFEPLPETRTEVLAITKLFAGGKVEVLLGEKATESALKRADLRRFGFLHFATHGILGNELPGLGEPALVLANESGEDGFLTASEIASLKLDAELTVLSACNTGSGEYYTGEGVMGIGRAFLVAGSRAVVVSLWPVASVATERLMVAFYRHLRSGASGAEALQRAKFEMIEQAQKSNPTEAHPFFWAPFVIIGG
jgi:CHAT domain-containing protein